MVAAAAAARARARAAWSDLLIRRLKAPTQPELVTQARGCTQRPRSDPLRPTRAAGTAAVNPPAAHRGGINLRLEIDASKSLPLPHTSIKDQWHCDPTFPRGPSDCKTRSEVEMGVAAVPFEEECSPLRGQSAA